MGVGNAEHSYSKATIHWFDTNYSTHTCTHISIPYTTTQYQTLWYFSKCSSFAGGSAFLFHHVANVRMQLGQHSIESLSGLSQTDIASAHPSERASGRASERVNKRTIWIYAPLYTVCHDIFVKWAQFVCTKPICLLCTQFYVLLLLQMMIPLLLVLLLLAFHSCISCYLVMYYHVKPDLLYNICQCLCLCAHCTLCMCIYIYKYLIRTYAILMNFPSLSVSWLCCYSLYVVCNH